MQYMFLRFPNGKTIYNPSLYEIWFDVDKKLYSIKPGETLKIQ